MIGMFGSLGIVLTYLDFVRLWLNLGRARLQRSYVIALGVGAVQSKEGISREWAEALASCPEEADELYAQWVRSRKNSSGPQTPWG